LPSSRSRYFGQRPLGAFAARRDDAAEVHLVHAERDGGGVQPGGGALGAEWEGAGRRRRLRASSARPVSPRKGLGEQVARVSARSAEWPARRPGSQRTGDAEFVEQARELVLDDVGQRADDEQFLLTATGPWRRAGSASTMAARQASSPSVKVVSIPLPE
jgi:hypothetical protein